MPNSVNGWPVLDPGSSRLRIFNIPLDVPKSGTVMLHLTLRDGSAGFLLALAVMRHHRYIENLIGSVHDEWGYNKRPIAGTDSWSNHASGTAADVNAVKHPYGKRGTFTVAQRIRMQWYIRVVFRNLLNSGEFWRTPDGMHWEVVGTLSQCEARAKALLKTGRGKRIIAANPGLEKVIYS